MTTSAATGNRSMSSVQLYPIAVQARSPRASGPTGAWSSRELGYVIPLEFVLMVWLYVGLEARHNVCALRSHIPSWICKLPTTIIAITKKKNTTGCLFHFVLFNSKHRRAGGIDLTLCVAKLLKVTRHLWHEQFRPPRVHPRLGGRVESGHKYILRNTKCIRIYKHMY